MISSSNWLVDYSAAGYRATESLCGSLLSGIIGPSLHYIIPTTSLHPSPFSIYDFRTHHLKTCSYRTNKSYAEDIYSCVSLKNFLFSKSFSPRLPTYNLFLWALVDLTSSLPPTFLASAHPPAAYPTIHHCFNIAYHLRKIRLPPHYFFMTVSIMFAQERTFKYE
jgi:hypothetical protein